MDAAEIVAGDGTVARCGLDVEAVGRAREEPGEEDAMLATQATKKARKEVSAAGTWK